MKRFLAMLILCISAATASASTEILEFGAQWCGPCRDMAPIVDQLAQSGIPIQKIDNDLAPEEARRYGIEKIPTILIVQDGKPVWRHEGPADAKALATVLRPYSQATHRTRNFVVYSSTQEFAKLMAEAAEKYRTTLATLWLGQEIPAWSQPCIMRVSVGTNLAACGETKFFFGSNRVSGWSSHIQGTQERLVDSVLPHEITHMILADHFKQPVPRWADEGAASMVEHASERARHRAALVTVLRTNRGIAFNRLFAMSEYPKDFVPLYAQGFALTDYLVQQGGHRKFIAYVGDGMQGNWVSATKRHYGIDNLGELQQRWVAWVGSGFPDVSAVAGATTPKPADAQADLPIPPTTLPAAPPDPASLLAQATPRPAMVRTEYGEDLARNYILPFREEVAAQQRSTTQQLEAIRQQLSEMNSKMVVPPTPAVEPPPLPPNPEANPVEDVAQEGPQTLPGKLAEKQGEFLTEHGGPLTSKLAESGVEKLQSDSPRVRFEGFTQVTVAWLIFLGVILLLFALLVRIAHKVNKRLLPILQQRAAGTQTQVDDRLVGLLQKVHDRVGVMEDKINQRIPLIGRIEDRVESLTNVGKEAVIAAVPGATQARAAADAIRELSGQ